jgi:hypothetical protein
MPSVEAYCASWHHDTQYGFWEILKGKRAAWMRDLRLVPVES